MYRSTGHVEFPKFQTGSFVERKAPGNSAQRIQNRASDPLAIGTRNPSSTDEEPKIHYLHFNQERKNLFLILRIF